MHRDRLGAIGSIVALADGEMQANPSDEYFSAADHSRQTPLSPAIPRLRIETWGTLGAW